MTILGSRRLGADKSYTYRQRIGNNKVLGCRRAIVGNGEGIGEGLSGDHRVKGVIFANNQICMRGNGGIFGIVVVALIRVADAGGNDSAVSDEAGGGGPP